MSDDATSDAPDGTVLESEYESSEAAAVAELRERAIGYALAVVAFFWGMLFAAFGFGLIVGVLRALGRS